MDSKAAQEDGKEDADDLVARGLLVLGVEPGALVVGHIGGVDGGGGLHVRVLQTANGEYGEWEDVVPGGVEVLASRGLSVWFEGEGRWQSLVVIDSFPRK